MRWLCIALVCWGCDSGGGGGDPVQDAGGADGAVGADSGRMDAGMGDDGGPVPDAAIADMAVEDAAPIPDAMRRRPVGADEPRAQACPATPREPQVTLAATGATEMTFDGPLVVEANELGQVRLSAEGGSVELGVPPRVAARMIPGTEYTALLRRRTTGFTEWLLVLRDPGGDIQFAAATGTSWVLQQFADRAAVGESVMLSGACAQAGEACFDRVDREMIFAGGNRRRALLPGQSSDFTTDGGSFYLAVDRAHQVSCAVLCPNVAIQWFSIWMLRDADVEPSDFDGDGVEDADDNCVRVVNADQSDADMDGIGDLCDQAPDAEGPGLACAHPLDCPSRRCLPEGVCEAGVFVVPGAPEVCDGDDDDGDGAVDEGIADCDPCQVSAVVTGEGLQRGEVPTLTATPSLEGACDGVSVQRIGWDLEGDGEEDGEGETLALRRLRGMAPISVVLRVEDSRGGVTEVVERLPVAESEFCP